MPVTRMYSELESQPRLFLCKRLCPTQTITRASLPIKAPRQQGSPAMRANRQRDQKCSKEATYCFYSTVCFSKSPGFAILPQSQELFPGGQTCGTRLVPTTNTKIIYSAACGHTNYSPKARKKSELEMCRITIS